jgi:hypothetical protein
MPSLLAEEVILAEIELADRAESGNRDQSA